MVIGVDGFEASVANRVGVGRLGVEILRGLARLDEKNFYRIYLPQPPLVDLPKAGSRWVYCLAHWHRFWSQLSLPFELFLDRQKIAAFLSLSHYAPRFCPVPYAIFILDLSYLYFPKMFKEGDRYKLVNWTKYSVTKARRIMAISQATKNDIIKFYQINPKKITVVYPGIMPVKTLNSSPQTILKKYAITGDYLLYVGTLQPRKNLVRLLEAFSQISAQYPKLKLVIVGKKGWLYDEIFRKTKQLFLQDKVIFTGFVSDDGLPYLYRGASALVLVSLYEGFGFPVLEAMSYGTPVVCSNVSSLPEIAGGAAILVEPTDSGKIREGLLKVLGLSPTEREKLVEKGRVQAKKFTWEKAAKETLAVIEGMAK